MNILIYTNNKKKIEQNLIKLIKYHKKIKIIVQNNINIIFKYKKKLCKEKNYKLLIHNKNIIHTQLNIKKYLQIKKTKKSN